MEGITLQEHFAMLEDPRVERTRATSVAGHHHHRVVCGDLWSRHLGRCGGVRKGTTSVVGDLCGPAQWDSLA